MKTTKITFTIVSALLLLSFTDELWKQHQNAKRQKQAALKSGDDDLWSTAEAAHEKRTKTLAAA